MKKLILLAGVLACSACVGDYPDHHARNYGMADRMFDKMDLNDDGVISRKEAANFSRIKFNDADTNNDDLVTRDEFRAEKYRDMHNYRGTNNDYPNDDWYLYDDDYAK